jgi:hypothetical protein
MSEDTLLRSLESEFRRYKGLAEAALDQLGEEELGVSGPRGGNSIAVLCQHIAGNLRSRFTDFLTSDGEKPWRRREEEFHSAGLTRADLTPVWEGGWQVLFDTLGTMRDDQLELPVRIRGQTLAVHEALFRSMAHIAYHVGQIVYVARELRGDQWRYLSIAPGQTAAFNQRISATGGGGEAR